MQNLLQRLEAVLQGDERLVVDGGLAKNKIIELVLAMDEGLLALLRADEAIRAKFFRDVGDVSVFDTRAFQRFVNNKQFLPDSYTAFKNKIGLTAGGEYLAASREVVLVWPYKDCVLEGGQTKEEQKRKEIFWNETLAAGEIDRLLAPKALTNFRKYDQKGEHRVQAFGAKDNLLIKGNNLLALHSLKKRVASKVKLIYIDPPYNTGNDSFGYNDSFNHSTWLTFMKNRLEAARELLRDDGVIFVHCDDNEAAYLKVLMDEVFGRENFIATAPRKTRSGKSDVPYKLSQDFDWMLMYTKEASKKDTLFRRTITRKYYTSPDFPDDEWRLSDLTKQTTIKERPKSNFTLVNPRNGEKFPVNPNRCWGVTVDTVDEYLRRKKIVFPGDYEFLNLRKPAMRIFKSEEIAKKGKDFDKAYVSSNFLNQAMDELLKDMSNRKGTDEIVELFGDKVIAYPKPELILQRILEYVTEEGDLVLDFFAGSGTTAAVAHKMNRRWIAVEQMEYVETVTVERLKKVIAGEQGGVSKEVGWQGGGDFVYCEVARHSADLIDRIEQADTPASLQALWREMEHSDFIRYQVKPEDINKNIREFSALSLEEQRQFLIEVLDKNQLYVNYSEIEDENHRISEEDRRLNRQFYGD